MLKANMGSLVYDLPGSSEAFFNRYRKNTIGEGHTFLSPYGRKPLLYADWAASGRLYRPIEAKLAEEFGPWMANTHTRSTITGRTMTLAYEEAKAVIKRHVNAGPQDMLVFAGTGMTGAVNKLQRLLGLKVPERFKSRIRLTEAERPVIFITHMEHHSNQLSWAETIGEVVVVPPGPEGNVEPEHLERLLRLYRHRRVKIGAFTACSNVTGFETPYDELARTMHRHGGRCFVDFSASAPYARIDMHPAPPRERLDGVLFSPHKFLGGPGTNGILVVDKSCCDSDVPDHPGGGTVVWTNPWGEYHYVKDADAREDGGTPGILQAIRAALCIRLKEEMGISRMRAREKELTSLLLQQLARIPGLRLLGGSHRDRLGIVSFTFDTIHYNLVVQLLNDRFGIQARGGCSCAGTYGHHLLGIGLADSRHIAEQIAEGDLSGKPGWVRLSLHPMMTDQEIRYIAAAIRDVAEHIAEWKKDYIFDPGTGEWLHRSHKGTSAPGF
ncbi:aminotransferase class V-fold PLP-dependent enzyme [Paenibacillus faecis]|uniref:Aminotransferase class V-fold PLP-dependent enzyme n=1 Tax=Paenibacillus faecis TaxID=862114 RepID=A0A5D0CQW5_9BACL|nr:aminotransferase class V-fold PLP-dependent enzyme [Paenibacillus faecis]TYA12148.1 aminotransferase class V-fold PLP-dependent enzyme [Paenibacillus faecis]